MTLPTIPADPALPLVTTLLGPQAGVVLAPAFPDAELDRLEPAQVRYLPGESITVQYRAEFRDADTALAVVATVGIPAPAESTVVSGPDGEITVWVYPADPHLPGLPMATRAAPAAGLLRQLGVDAGPPALRTRAYRAGRRAVVEARLPSERAFFKVVRPRRVQELHDRHQALAGSVPVPHSLGVAPEHGIVVLQAMPGVPLRRAIEDGQPLPDPAALVALLDQFPTEGSLSRVRGAAERSSFHANLLMAVLPSWRDRIAEIAERVGDADDEPLVPVHGDLHASQLLVGAGSIVGLVDVDTAGRGRRSDDLGNLVGHLATVASMSAKSAAFDAYGRTLIDHFDGLVPPDRLRRKAAATIFALATGPFRVQMGDWPAHTARRLSLAERWLESADNS